MKKYIILFILICVSSSYAQLNNIINKTPAELAKIVDGQTDSDAAYWESHAYLYIKNIVDRLQADFLQANDYATLSAAISAASTDTLSVMASSRYNITTNTTLSGQTAIIARQGARFNISSGKTLTINMPFYAGDYQIFEGNIDSVFFNSSYVTEVNPRWFGAKVDGSTNDIAALNAAINSIGDTGSNRAGIDLLIPGPMAINTTLHIRKKSIRLKGFGWRIANDNNFNGSAIIWIGNDNAPVIRYSDIVGGFRIENLRIIGDTTTAKRPNAAISIYETNDGQPNQSNVIQNVMIGTYSFESAVLNGNQFSHGILVEGDLNTNNAESAIRDTRINSCDSTNIKIGGTQNLLWRFDNVETLGADISIWNAGEFYASNYFNSGADTLYYSPNKDIFGNSVNSVGQFDYLGGEKNGRLAVMVGSGILEINGGYFQTSSANTNSDGKIIRIENNNNQRVVISNFSFDQIDAPSTAPFFSIKSNPSGASSKDIVLSGVYKWANINGGPNANGLDVETQGPTDLRYVYIQEAGNIASSTPFIIAQNYVTGSSQNWNPERWDITHSISIADSMKLGSSGKYIRETFQSVGGDSIGVKYYNTVRARVDTVWLVQ